MKYGERIEKEKEDASQQINADMGIVLGIVYFIAIVSIFQFLT